MDVCYRFCRKCRRSAVLLKRCNAKIWYLSTRDAEFFGKEPTWPTIILPSRHGGRTQAAHWRHDGHPSLIVVDEDYPGPLAWELVLTRIEVVRSFALHRAEDPKATAVKALQRLEPSKRQMCRGLARKRFDSWGKIRVEWESAVVNWSGKSMMSLVKPNINE